MLHPAWPCRLLSSTASTARRLVRARGGNAAIEFAIIATPLAALMVAELQTSLVFFAQQNLETATEKAVRQLMTGQAQKSGMSASSFRTLMCSKLPDFMKCANVVVSVKTISAFDGADTSLPNVGFNASGAITNADQYSPGGPGSINIVKISYVWKVAPGPLGFDLSNMSGQRRLLIATAVFKTEPYNS